MAKTSYVPSGAKIKVIGMGGGGCNAITRMVREGIRGVEFIAMNSDAQHLAVTEAAVRIQLGERLTRGLGAGGDHIVGQKAAAESSDEIKEAVIGADMVFVTAGMGGGTGTGSIPIVAQIAKQSGALTIGVVTKPFTFEGTHRNKVAEGGIVNLMDKVDTLVIIPNDRLFNLCDQKAGVDGAFKLADEVLHHGVQAIAEVVTVPGLINLDFADVRSVMKDAGPAWMSIGRGSGQNRVVDAAKEALSSPLLDVTIEGAKGVLFNITGGGGLSLSEVNNAAEVIRQAIDPEANIIFGVVLDSNMGNDVRLTLIATGFADRNTFVSASWEKEIMKLLKGKSEEELEVPTFMRNHRVLPSQRSRPVNQQRKYKNHAVHSRLWRA
ncbi:cell division protein FtsZ [Chloroflexota bacterium]